MRRQLIVVLLCLGGALVFLLLNKEPSAGLFAPLAKTNDGAPRRADLPEAPLHREQQPVVPRFFDRLTRQPLDESVEVLWVSGPRESGKSVREGLPREVIQKLKGSWVLEMAGENLGRVSLAESAMDEAGNFSLPYLARVELELPDLPEEDFLGFGCQAGVVDAQAFAALRMEKPDGLLAALHGQGTLEYALQGYEASGRTVPWQETSRQEKDNRHFFRWEGPATQTLLLRLQSDQYGNRLRETKAIAGETIILTADLFRGPTVMGVLRDETGTPIPDVRVKLYSEVGPDGDWGNLPPGFSLRVGGHEGEWHRCIRGSALTDAEGRFSLAGLRGIRFAAEYSGETRYGFVESLEMPSNYYGEVALTLVARPFSEWYPVHVENPDGSAASGVYVRSLLGNDYPWFRGFASVPVDSKGVGYLVGLSEGLGPMMVFVLPGRDLDPKQVLLQRRLNALPPAPLKLVLEATAEEDSSE